MANIKHLLDDIRKNKYCVDMKETFCNALNEANANAEEIESTVKKIKNEITSVNANAEIIDARGGKETLGERLNEFDAQLDKIETKKIDKKSNKVIFMPVEDNESKVAGDCSVIITRNGTVIMIDTGTTESYSKIKEILNKNNVTKIDYVFISHYHSDHCQNLGSLINNFDMKNTKYYLQKHTTKFTYSDNYVLNLASNNIIIYPNNDDTLIVDDIKFTFFNCSQTDIDYYDANTTNYNNYSMCVYCDYYNTSILFTGDISESAQARINDLGYFKKVDLLKVEHHGYDLTVNNDYLRIVNPKYGVISESDIAFSQKDSTINCESTCLLNAMGTEIGCTGKGAIEFYFNESGNEFVNNFKVGGCVKDTGKYVYIYLDSSYTGISDGTYHKPFRSVREALAEANKLKLVNVFITPKSGTFSSEEHLRIINFDGTIKLDKISVRGFDIRNSYVILDNFTVTGTHNRAIVIESSIIEFTNLTVNGDCKNANTAYDGRGVTIYKSKVNGTNLTISNKRIALCCYNNSDVYIENLKGANNEYALICVTGSKLINNNATIEYDYRFKDIQDTSYIGGKISNDFTDYLAMGDDLNNLKTAGTRYVSKTGDITQSLLNIPNNLGYAFVIEIKKQTEDGSILQELRSRHFTNVNGTTNKTGIFYRTYNNADGWSAWYEMVLKLA